MTNFLHGVAKDAESVSSRPAIAGPFTPPPDATDVARTATYSPAARTKTTAKLLSPGWRVLGAQPDIQQQLRDDYGWVPACIRECLRINGPVNSLVRRAGQSTASRQTCAAGKCRYLRPRSPDPAGIGDKGRRP